MQVQISPHEADEPGGRDDTQGHLTLPIRNFPQRDFAEVWGRKATVADIRFSCAEVAGVALTGGEEQRCNCKTRCSGNITLDA